MSACCGGGKSNRVHPLSGHEALGRVYCARCFVCNNYRCGASLSNGFFEVDKLLYCRKCKKPETSAMSEKQAMQVRNQVNGCMLRQSTGGLLRTSKSIMRRSAGPGNLNGAVLVFEASFDWVFKKETHIVGRDTVAAVHRLLPLGKPAEAALVFIEDREDKTSGHLLEMQVRAATTWVLDALCHAYEDDRIKLAVRQLLATATFSCNLDAVWYSEDPPQRCFSDFLKPGLEARLVKLGQHLAFDYIAKDIRAAFAPETVLAAVGDSSNHPLCRQAGMGQSPTQIHVLPCGPSGKYVDFTKPWTFPDSIYAHALLMVAHATDSFFQEKLSVIIAMHNEKYKKGTGTAKLHPAPRKAFPRVFTKMRSDYRHQPPPRAQ